jgi:predicted adenine nucleotide alpha hydrolase (AANH) superfamily ATPase
MTEKKSCPQGCTWASRSGKCAEVEFDPVGNGMMRKHLLLHSCCGPCSTAVIERLAADYEITVFFYNPCITDAQEYEKRKLNQLKFIEAVNKKAGCESGCINFIEGDYEPDKFLQRVRGLEDEPEGGKRCTACFSMRLEKTAAYAARHGYPIFGTTLTVSPHKNYQLISRIGLELAEEYGVEFLDMDFKKQAGFQRSVQLSKEYGLYRQDYCGCDFSRR